MSNLNFEKSIEKLEKIVEKLEKGDLGLDEMLDLFEKGVKLSKECASILDAADKKVNILIKGEDGTIKKEQFTQGE
jgi:exodeoxyribonuclease VII small subunit